MDRGSWTKLERNLETHPSRTERAGHGMKVLGVIPARYKSTRLPAKPLADILGKPMVQHVYENAKRAVHLDSVVVATEDERIFAAVKAFGGMVVMTSPDHLSGTDRVAEVAAGSDAAIVVNIQGDEP